MNYLIGLSAGHQNIANNCVFPLRSGTGANGEAQLNIAVRDALGAILISKGFKVQLDDANSNCQPNTTDKDFSFYLAIHAEGAPGGGCISAPDPSVDSANNLSKQICAAIESQYFSYTGIQNRPELITDNMRYYYVFNSLSSANPCGIIELGGITDPHDKVILANIDKVAQGIARGICKAFSVPYDAPIPPLPPVKPTDKQYLLMVRDIVRGKGNSWAKITTLTKLMTTIGI